jgi:exonuclease III
MAAQDSSFDTNDNVTCLRKSSIDDFWHDSKNIFLPCDSYVKYNIVNINIRSIHANFRSLLTTLNDQFNKIDVLILSEINCQEKDLPKFKIQGFKQIAKPRLQGRGGGLLFYVRECFKAQDIQIKFNKNVSETLTILIDDEVLVAAFYRPPSKSKTQFIVDLSNFFSETCSKYKNIVFCGDININLLDEQDTSVVNYMSTLNDFGFSNCIFYPTREEFSGNNFSSTLIDHVYFKSLSLECLSAVLTFKIADHYATSLLVYEVNKSSPPQIRTKTNFSQTFKDLAKFPWKKCKDNTDPNLTFKNFGQVMQNIRTINTYTEQFQPRSSGRRTEKLWVTAQLIALAAERDRAFRRMKSNPTNALHREEYKKLRNKVNNKLKYAEKTFVINKLKTCQGNVKETWNVLNTLLGRARNSLDDTIIRYMSKFYSREEILRGFGDQFSLAASNNSHVCDFRALIRTTQTPDTLQCMYLPRANVGFIEYIVKNLNKNKGPGFDKVSVLEVQNAGQDFLIQLTQTINTCRHISYYPDDIKVAIVRPLYKGGQHKQFENYRPISLLPVADKIFEKYLDFHLSSYLKEFDIIDKRQFAYQKGRNVNELFGDFSNYINNNMSSKNHTAAIFIDYKKAFDVIDHKLLLDKLSKIGIQGPTLKLFESFLSNRKFAVMINGEQSELFDVTAGVAQGSILGPKLFLIYMLDLFPILRFCKILMFADDIVILYSHSNFNTCNSILQADFNILVEWSHDNCLYINMKKTVCMHFCIKSMRGQNKLNLICHDYECLHNFHTSCNCKCISQVSSCVYLGLHVDEDFSWKNHVNHLVSKLRTVVREMTFARSRLTYSAKRIVYHSIAHSHLNYGITAWGSANLTPLLDIQKKILYKMCTKTHQNSVTNLYKFWNVLPVNKIFEVKILELKYFEHHGTIRQHPYSTRSSRFDVIVEPRSENKYFERTFEYIVPRLWNTLPEDLKNCQSIITVKRKLKKWTKKNL